MADLFFEAGEDLTGQEGRAVVVINGLASLPTAAGGNAAGVLVVGAAQGGTITLRTSGVVADCLAVLPFGVGALLAAEVGGGFRVAGPGEAVVARAFHEATAAGARAAVELHMIGVPSLPLEGGVPVFATKGPKTTKGAPHVDARPREGSRLSVISQNFCDARTWYASSTRTTAQLVDSGDGLTWTLPTPAVVVDVTHGRLTDEREIRAAYAPVVRVDGAPVVEHSPDTTDGDFGIDYRTGAVTFTTTRAGSVVEMDHSKAISSEWWIAPAAGKVIRLTAAELQFSTDARMRDTFLFQPRGEVDKHPALAALWDANGGPYPAGTKIGLGPPTAYQTVMDLVNEANVSHPLIPALASSPPTWRDLPVDLIIFRWEYSEQATIDLRSDWGMDVSIRLERDTECQGFAAVATFYGLSEDV